MFKALLVTRLLSFRESLFGRTKKKAGTSKTKIFLYTVLALYVIASLFFSVGMMFFLVAKPLINANLGWLVLSIASMMYIVVSFAGSIFMAEQQLFEAKDNDLLLSMPVPPSYILASRIILIVFSNMLFGLIILLPAFIVYCIFAPKVTAVMIVIFILGLILISLFSTALTSACGWVIAIIASRLRRKNFISTVLILALLFGYMYFYMNLQNYAAQLLMNGAAISQAISRALPPFFYYGTAIDGSNIMSLLGFALWCIVPFALVYYILSKSFVRIAATKRGTVKVKYVEKELKISSVRSALIKKEIEKFFSLPMYILNCSLGAIMALIFAAALIVKRDLIVQAFTSTAGSNETKTALLVCGILCFMAIMDDITAPSISLEAKTLWILRSTPIRPADIFFAKVAASLVITLPPLFLSAIIVSIVLKFSPVLSLFLILIPALAQIFISIFGLVLNLNLPRFEWVSEVAVIKQSASVMFAIFGGMGVVAVPVLVYIFFAAALSAEIYLILCTVYLALLTYFMFLFLKKKGEMIFNNLS